MKNFLISALLAALVCAASPSFAAIQNYAPGEVIAVLGTPSSAAKISRGSAAMASALSSQAQNFAAARKLSVASSYRTLSSQTGANILRLRSSAKTTEQLIEELKDDPGIRSVQPNYASKAAAVPNDPYFSTPVKDNIKQWAPQLINAPYLWDRCTGSKEIVVAVIDTGIDYRHPDLAANMVKDSYGNPGRHFYMREDGEVYNWDPFPKDAGYETGPHGTHVAGIIGAAGNNGIGVAGINWRVGLLAVNIFTSTGFGETDETAYDSNTIEGINYILDEKKKGLNIRVANMSICGWQKPIPPESAYALAVKAMSDAGILVVIAAGNEAQNVGDPGEGRIPGYNQGKNYAGMLPYPAAFREALTISVGATGPSDEIAFYSNYGKEWVDLAAPGGNPQKMMNDETSILSTTGAEDWNSQLQQYGYRLMSGTSMAAPHVAGAAALLMAAFPEETAAQIKERLLRGAYRIGVDEGCWKYGRLDLKGAYDYQFAKSEEESPSGGCNAGASLLLLIPLAIPLLRKC